MEGAAGSDPVMRCAARPPDRAGPPLNVKFRQDNFPILSAALKIRI